MRPEVTGSSTSFLTLLSLAIVQRFSPRIQLRFSTTLWLLLAAKFQPTFIRTTPITPSNGVVMAPLQERLLAQAQTGRCHSQKPHHLMLRRPATPPTERRSKQ